MEADLRSGRDARLTICRLDEIPDGGARGFTVETASGVRDILIVRRGDTIFAYENSCPHVGTPLDWVSDQFLSEDGSHIVCATHGAQFRIEDGMCFSGPCHGVPLPPIAVKIRDGAVMLAES
ncbi:MAG: Rieske (2Fe-2S) protein [Alphaproteobacteria bacterium]|nr:Rieske (2Fe-2S) protein [Alphaproteobacteria bacterium]